MFGAPDGAAHTALDDELEHVEQGDEGAAGFVHEAGPGRRVGVHGVPVPG